MANVKRNQPLLTTRLGPPELSPSEVYGIAQWEIWKQSQDEAERRRRGGDWVSNEGAENAEERENQHASSSLERFLKTPDTSYPVYSKEFRFYNSHLWNRNGYFEPTSSPPFKHIADSVKRVFEINPITEVENLKFDRFQLIQRRRRQRQVAMPLKEKILREQVVDK